MKSTIYWTLVTTVAVLGELAVLMLLTVASGPEMVVNYYVMPVGFGVPLVLIYFIGWRFAGQFVTDHDEVHPNAVKCEPRIYRSGGKQT